MTQEHPITPSPELYRKWEAMPRSVAFEAAYRAGADQELEACCGWIESQSELGKRSFTTEARVKFRCEVSDRLRAARRPKPPSLKERALAELDLLKADATTHGLGFDAPAIRRALEQLDD